MLARCPWRRSKSVEPTSPRGNTSGNSTASAFLITAPLSSTPQSTLWSTNTSHLFALPRLWLTYSTIKGEWSVYLIRKVIVTRRPGPCCHGLLSCQPVEVDSFHNSCFIFAVTPHFGDQSMAATWLKGPQGSRMAGQCQSLTQWRATWGRDDERPHLSWTQMKPSVPSPHFQGSLVLCSFITDSGDESKTNTNQINSLVYTNCMKNVSFINPLPSL